jgi:hypothetical protein
VPNETSNECLLLLNTIQGALITIANSIVETKMDGVVTFRERLEVLQTARMAMVPVSLAFRNLSDPSIDAILELLTTHELTLVAKDV